MNLIGVKLDKHFISLGRFDHKGKLLHLLHLPTPQPPMPGAITVALCEAINQMDPKQEIDLIGISLSSKTFVDIELEKVMLDLPGWDELPFLEWLESRLTRKVTFSPYFGFAMLLQKTK